MLVTLISIGIGVILFLIILVLMLGIVSAMFPSKSPPRFRRRPRIEPQIDADDLRPEYDFDYSTGQRNRFAHARAIDEAVTIALAPDVARVFKTSDAVNAVLRALIATMPEPGRGPDKPTDS